MKRCIIFLALLAHQPLFADRDESRAMPGLLIPGRIIIYMNSRAPLSFETLSPNQIPKDAVDIGTVSCSSCQHGLSIPVTAPTGISRGTTVSGARGDGGFEKALENLKLSKPELRGIYDVKVDYHRISVLGIYRKQCMEISARGFK